MVLPFKSVDAVDAAFGGAWSALGQAAAREHAAAAESAFDTVLEALSDADADRMSDAVAAVAAKASAVAVDGASAEDATAAAEAVSTLVMLREVLRWRAAGSPCAAATDGVGDEAASGVGGGAAAAKEVAEAAAEDAARVLHQLFTISRSWGTLNKWSGGTMLVD